MTRGGNGASVTHGGERWGSRERSSEGRDNGIVKRLLAGRALKKKSGSEEGRVSE